MIGGLVVSREKFQLLFVHLDIDGDFHLVAEHWRGELWPEVEVGALDDGGGGEAADEASLLVLLWGCGAVHVKNDRLGDAGEGEVAFNLQVASGSGYFGGLEVDRRELGHVEEVGALEVLVARVDGGVDGGRIQISDHAGLAGVFFVPDDGAGDLADGAADVGDAHVANLKAGLRVHGVDVPGAGLGGGDAGSQQNGSGGGKKADLHGVILGKNSGLAF